MKSQFNFKLHPALALGILFVCVTTAYADQMYVSDKLVVGVFPEAGSETGKIASLESGDLVEVLERTDKFVRIRLSDNREGWVKANYLTTQVPAIVRLKELQSATGATPAAATPTPQATEELKKLKDLNTSLQTEIGVLKQAAQVAAAQPPTPAVQSAVQTTAPQVTPVTSTSEPQGRLEGERTLSDEPSDSRQHLMWVASIGLVCGGLGYLLGYQSLARRIRNKYGNVKIY